MNITPCPDQELRIQEALNEGLIKHESEILDIGLDLLLKMHSKKPKWPILLDAILERLDDLEDVYLAYIKLKCISTR